MACPADDDLVCSFVLCDLAKGLCNVTVLQRRRDLDPTASQLLDNPKVALRVEALQKEAERLSLYNVKAEFP